jgi:hypothetical protein
MTKKIILFLSLFSSVTAFSQKYVDILKINVNTTPLNKFDSSASKTRVNELVADLTVPIKLNDSNAVITGLVYEGMQAKLFENQAMKSVSAIILKAGFEKKFNTIWSGTFVVLPKIASDFVAIGNKDFQVGGIAIMKYKKKENLNYRMGLYYNSELFGPLFVPMLGLYYLSPDKKLETTIMMPLQADVNYKLSSHLNIGFNYNAQIKSFHLTNVTPAYNSTYLTKATDDFFIYAKLHFTKAFSLQTRLGQSVERSNKIFNENDRVDLGLPAIYIGNNRHQLNTNFSNGLLFQFMLLYRFNLPD